MDLESRCARSKSSCRHPEEVADGSLRSKNLVMLKDDGVDGTGSSEHSATYQRGQFDDQDSNPFGIRSFYSEESALEDLFQAKTAKLTNSSLRSVGQDNVSSGLTSSSPVSDLTYETAFNSLARQSPPVQVKERCAGYDPDRISSSIFERSGSGTPLEWSAASNESLFSLNIGNASFIRNHNIMLGRDQQHESEESEKPVELIIFTPPPTVKMVETEGNRAVNWRKPRPAKVADDSMKEHIKEAAVGVKEERFYTPTASWDSSRVSNQSDGCTTSTCSTMKCSWPFCCFVRPSCSWGSCCCKMPSCKCTLPSCGCSDCSWSFCSCSCQSCCCCNGKGAFCSNWSCSSSCCCSGETCCSSWSCSSLCCFSGEKFCSSWNCSSLCCFSGEKCCSSWSRSLKSLCCCSGKTCSPGFCCNCDCDIKRLCGCWNCNCCRNISCCSLKCCG